MIDPLRNPEGVHLSRADALKGGDGRSLRRGRESGTLVSIRRGVYTETSIWSELAARDRYLLQMRAVLETRKGDAVLGYESAAAVWNMPIIGPWPDAVHVFTADGRRRSSSRGVRWHNAPLLDGDVVEVDGILVTSRLRTLLDLARRSGFMSAVASLDAGLAFAVKEHRTADAATRLREMLVDRLDQLGSAPGSRRARYAVEFASHLADSPGESASRVQIHLCGFPQPVLQFPVVDRNGTLWHADVGWPEHRLLGEFDGFAKYTRDAYTRGTPIEEIVWAEKRREDLMRAARYGMVRWLWTDALRAPLLTRILLDAGLPRNSSGAASRITDKYTRRSA
ncbi:type IV toxin-antitoxin system AbiEi family antitoxin domain-containing protein [Mycetocola miduiensis]|uniref:Transcriptional regulator, AbiEi antitoxin, Type IV TA system n=1 Tax=Mycetocola miduiensis TaxID=995034 RepID=A0A1I5CB90_9MICO|nr:hypothetical protein [Mycetocola miduiensis]SFN84233.1 Transcriptional regulator, AbiEi antitoxin, Type IV TA system [Mycetocola miduiensis]